MGIRCPKAVKGEATGQTSDGSKKALERLCHVMGNKILIHLQRARKKTR